MGEIMRGTAGFNLGAEYLADYFVSGLLGYWYIGWRIGALFGGLSVGTDIYGQSDDIRNGVVDSVVFPYEMLFSEVCNNALYCGDRLSGGAGEVSTNMESSWRENNVFFCKDIWETARERGGFESLVYREPIRGAGKIGGDNLFFDLKKAGFDFFGEKQRDDTLLDPDFSFFGTEEPLTASLSGGSVIRDLRQDFKLEREMPLINTLPGFSNMLQSAESNYTDVAKRSCCGQALFCGLADIKSGIVGGGFEGLVVFMPGVGERDALFGNDADFLETGFAVADVFVGSEPFVENRDGLDSMSALSNRNMGNVGIFDMQAGIYKTEFGCGTVMSVGGCLNLPALIGSGFVGNVENDAYQLRHGFFEGNAFPQVSFSEHKKGVVYGVISFAADSFGAGCVLGGDVSAGSIWELFTRETAVQAAVNAAREIDADLTESLYLKSDTEYSSIGIDELKELRGSAAGESYGGFSSAEIKVDMSGMRNNFNGGSDFDVFISELTDAVCEAVSAVSEGVHS